tara:strand:+ start:454 stop:624 length:171 start_codon:yes stop_codon:yes gene_type:complete
MEDKPIKVTDNIWLAEEKIYCPWAHAYELCKDNYTQDEIDDMLFCEIKELILDYEE